MKTDKNDITLRPKHKKLARLVEGRLRKADSGYIRYFRDPQNTIAILDEAGLLRPGVGKLRPNKKAEERRCGP